MKPGDPSRLPAAGGVNGLAAAGGANRFAAAGRYLAVSGSSFAVNLGITAGLHDGFGVGPEIAFAIALAVVFLMNFAAMRWWIFAGTKRPLRSQFLGFGLSSIGFRGLEYCGYWVLLRSAGIDYRIAAATTLAVAFAAKYVVYNSWLFARARA